MTTTGEQHDALRSLLGAWALGACPPAEAAELELHLRVCPECAEEAARLREAAGWLAADEPLDQPGSLRQQVLDWCLARRPAELPVPAWGVPYAAETAKLDALLRDLGPQEWQEVAELPWHGGTEYLRPAEVLCHLSAVDGYVALALGLPDPVPALPGSAAPVERRVPPQQPDAGPRPPRVPSQGGRYAGITDRTARLRAGAAGTPPQSVRARWRRQTHDLVRTAALAPQGNTPVDFGFATVPLRDAFVDRAFECFVHGEDVARAVAYPYDPPAPQHLRQMVELAVRMVPHALAGLRAAAQPAGAPAPPEDEAGGRRLRLVIDGPAAGEWLIPLDGPHDGRAGARGDAPPGGEPVASMVLAGLEFCQLAAGHRDPERVPVGEHGDRAAIREVLRAVPLLSRP